MTGKTATGGIILKKLFFGGNIITMAKPGFAEAVAVEDGIIAAVGDLKELENSRFDMRFTDKIL